MTFLGEWGDRSQIATIAMAAGQDYWWVTGGAISGHAVCTAAAVIGGRAIAGKVSMRVGKLNLPSGNPLNYACINHCDSDIGRRFCFPRIRIDISSRGHIF